MDALFIWYPKCSTCQKAKKELEETGITFTLKDIVTQTPVADELRDYLQKSGMPLEKFYNTSGKQYRAQDIKNKRLTMSETEQLQLLSENGMLLKRPLLIYGDQVIIGYKPGAYLSLK